MTDMATTSDNSATLLPGGAASCSSVSPTVTVFLISTLVLATTCSAEDWTTLSGQIVVTGDVPEAATLDITRDEEFCGAHGLVDESLIVNPKNRGLKNVVVWLSSKKPVPVHPSFPKSPEPAQLDNKNCTFQPRIVKLRTNQILQSTNADPVAHNVAVYARRNQPFSIVVPEDKPLERSFDREELLPIRVDCSIHAWMRAHLIITEHPYSAITDEAGNFKIPNLPQGEWEFRFWHERPGYLKTINMADNDMPLSRGMVALSIRGEEMNLGPINVSAQQLLE